MLGAVVVAAGLNFVQTTADPSSAGLGRPLRDARGPVASLARFLSALRYRDFAGCFGIAGALAVLPGRSVR